MDGTIIESAILGLIQGFTEFLPISSSAHLSFFTWFFNWVNITPDFIDLLNFGTLLALCIYFFKDGIKLVKSGFTILFSKNKENKDPDTEKSGKLFWYIILATIPTVIIYFILNKISDAVIGDNAGVKIILIAIASIIMGILLFVVDKLRKIEKSYDDLSLKDVLIIGVSQAFAATLPGISRSGVTITTSRALKYDRASSAKISFFLAIPIIAGGLIYKLKDFDFAYIVPLLIGNVISFVVGLLAINLLMKYLQKGKYSIFAIYRVCFGILLIALAIMRGF